jgi:hypothetical protein
MEFSKVNVDNNALHAQYSNIMMEWDKVMRKTTRLEHAVQEVYNKFLEVPMEVDTPLE